MADIIENLRKNGFAVTEFDTAAQAADYLAGRVHGKTVGMGGSITLQQLGLYDKLKEAGETVYWHQVTPGDGTLDAAATAQAYICSANAISQEGYILNIDGRGNRVSATLSRKETVYFVVGENKLSGPFPEALERARNVAGPRNAQRLHKNTPCAAKGDRCYDCASPDRICNALVVLWRPISGCGSMEVVLVHEELGY